MILRLLKLPKRFQKWIISGAIPASYLRPLLPLADYPKLLEAIAEDMEELLDAGDLSTSEFADEIACRLQKVTRPAKSCFYERKLDQHVEFALSEVQIAAFDPIELTDPLSGKRYWAVCNVKEFDRLKDAYIKQRVIEKRVAEAKTKGANRVTKPANKTRAADKPRTDAERKRAAAERKQKAEQRKGDLKASLARFSADWLLSQKPAEDQREPGLPLPKELKKL